MAKSEDSTELVESKFFIPITDTEIPDSYKEEGEKCRELATQQDKPITNPVCYWVFAGFTARNHASRFGPCQDGFRRLQRMKFDDKPTVGSYVLWVPGVIPGSTSKDVKQQLEFLSSIKTDLGGTGNFGEVALVAGLLIAHYRFTGERLQLVVRTDTCGEEEDYRLTLDWNGKVLRCVAWRDDNRAYRDVGVLALWVKPIS